MLYNTRTVNCCGYLGCSLSLELRVILSVLSIILLEHMYGRCVVSLARYFQM